MVSSLTTSSANNVTAEKGQDVQITCQLGLVSPWTDQVLIFKSQNANLSVSEKRVHLAICLERSYWSEQVGLVEKYECVPSPSNSSVDLQRYNITSDGHNIYILIAKLDRREDELFWTCLFSDSPEIQTQMYMSVYTTPANAILNSSVPDSHYTHSLSDSSISFTCRTDKCTYKDPVFKWYILFINGSRQIFEQGETHTWSSTFSCNDSESMYCNRLTLQENMTFANNFDQTVRFICGISFPTLSDDLLSLPSGNISFAVTVTSVQLCDGDLDLYDDSTIPVIENVTHSVICKPGPSRPSPIYEFYLGAQQIQESKNNTVTFIPNRYQHNCEIYCQAYNLQEPEKPAVSEKPKLYVQLPIEAVTLKQDSYVLDNNTQINATDDTPISLTCHSTPVLLRPWPIFLWYIGDQLRQNSTYNNFTFTRSQNDFTFTPETKNHNRDVYCLAYNVHGIQPVVSTKPKLFVTGRPAQPQTFLFTGSHGSNATFYWIAGYNGGYNQSFVLQYRQLGDNEWMTRTPVTDSQYQDNDVVVIPEYSTQISDLAPGEYQARLISRNIRGEATPVTVTGSTFQIHPTEYGGATSTQSSLPTVVTGVVLGCVILCLLGVTVYLLILLKRNKLPSNATRSNINFDAISNSLTQIASTYETLQATEGTTGSAYDSLGSSEIYGLQPIVYENTAMD